MGGTGDDQYDCNCLLFPLVPGGGYTGMASDDTHFQLQDVNLYVQGLRFDMVMASDAGIDADTSTSYTVATQKNGHRNEKVVQGSSEDALC
jgi:hypothetical protein